MHLRQNIDGTKCQAQVLVGDIFAKRSFFVRKRQRDSFHLVQCPSTCVEGRLLSFVPSCRSLPTTFALTTVVVPMFPFPNIIIHQRKMERIYIINPFCAVICKSAGQTQPIEEDRRGFIFHYFPCKGNNARTTVFCKYISGAEDVVWWFGDPITWLFRAMIAHRKTPNMVNM